MACRFGITKRRAVFKHWKGTHIMCPQFVSTQSFLSSLLVQKMVLCAYGMRLLTGIISEIWTLMCFIYSSNSERHSECVNALRSFALFSVIFKVLKEFYCPYLFVTTDYRDHGCFRRLENTLNYGLERVWTIGYLKSSNRYVPCCSV